jgi:integrase/recombinase XerD
MTIQVRRPRRESPLRKRMTEDLTLSGKAPLTIENYTGAVHRLARHYDRPPDQLSEQEIRTYLLYLVEERKIAWGTFAIALNGIKFFYEVTLGREWEIFDLARPRYERKLPIVLSREEVWRILDAVTIPVYTVCLTTIYACGLRLMEGIPLTPQQVDGDRMFVHIHGKGAKDRYVPLQAETLQMLREHWRTHRCASWLFPARPRKGRDNLATDAGPLHRSSLRSAFCRARDKAGVSKKAHVHTLRHSYATHLLEDGAALPVIQSYLGHARLSSTSVYLHLTRKICETASDPVARLMRRPRAQNIG